MSDLGQSSRKGMLTAAVVALLLAGGVQAQAAPMGDMPGMSDKAGPESGKQQTASATGTVAAVNAGQHKVTFDHQPIPAINWPAMHMEFPAAASVDLSKVKPGEKVKFTLSGSKGSYTVQSITPAQ
ncbi:copper-binding protein [Methylobacterium persicinum]|uniref:Cu(I)/Ag(I) efflux system protein CusF n=1 Tax=Methylobacterium persicinum TaxID=374426 RepID=A0ABU0HSJ0_9HYPH|nr:copper-binding protein [Methylobacterium persicinum]MDQ0445292.1 Cu(I)/Ag(I) efflux system protein CusF [Methylobacterium persicinum]GJE36170.1 Cation efflux system protein CusF [Methylobacterium persicinum]